MQTNTMKLLLALALCASTAAAFAGQENRTPMGKDAKQGYGQQPEQQQDAKAQEDQAAQQQQQAEQEAREAQGQDSEQPE
jgi:hypothetical protein